MIEIGIRLEPSTLAYAGDPPVRPDGRCARWARRDADGERECERKRPKPATRYAGTAAAFDPFCSTKCCRAWYGIDFAEGHDALRARRGRPRIL